jgi:hypothetical protein
MRRGHGHLNLRTEFSLPEAVGKGTTNCTQTTLMVNLLLRLRCCKIVRIHESNLSSTGPVRNSACLGLIRISTVCVLGSLGHGILASVGMIRVMRLCIVFATVQLQGIWMDPDLSKSRKYLAHMLMVPVSVGGKQSISQSSASIFAKFSISS